MNKRFLVHQPGPYGRYMAGIEVCPVALQVETNHVRNSRHNSTTYDRTYTMNVVLCILVFD